ncbi:acetylcholine receptor subunit beta-like [Pecten maximus]|uniref:acetylcholine receptor subunit beta-like n=1 Tax=Pecten maximus TaxID=6579 RepID=UPI001458D1DE|nr:acetylcholine receptor subunit beta-like [Pecten maximus]
MMPLLFILSVSLTTIFGTMHGNLTKLHRHLMANYSPEFRPALNLSEPTTVNIKFYPFSLKEFEEKTSKLSIVGVFVIEWHDFQLKWNPDEFGDLNRMLISQNTLWKPDILLMNPFEKIEPPGFDRLKILVLNDGSVSWAPPDVFEVSCAADITYYPFDQHTCLFHFSIYMYNIFEVLIKPDYYEITLDYYSPNSLWKMKFASSRVLTHTDSQILVLKMIFQRRPMFQVINTILPFCFLGFLNIMVFLLPTESGERVGFSVTVLLAIAVFMTIVADTLPGTSEPSFPRLCYLLVAELGINMLVTICTILVLRLHHKPQHQKIPSWLAYIIGKSVRCNAKMGKGHKLDLINESSICLETTVSTISESGKGNKKDLELNIDLTPSGNGVTQTQRKHVCCKTSWQDVAKFLDLFFFILFMIFFGTSKIAAYFAFA